MEDRQIVNQFMQGNHAVFDVLVQRYKQRIYFFALKINSQPSGCRRLVPGSFFACLPRITQLASRRIAIFLATCHRTNCYRSLKRKPCPTIVATEQIEQLTSIEARVEARLATAEIQEKLRRAIAGLPRKQQLVLVLRTYEELSYQQISRMLEISLDAVKANLSYARQNLRQQLKEQLS